jgi:hypothetical protein
MHEVPEPDHQLKVPVVQRPAYTLTLERGTKCHTFVHCDVHVRWTKVAKQQLLDDLKTLKSLHVHPIYAIHGADNLKLGKFIRSLGFAYNISYVDALSGHLTHIYSI